MFIEASARQLKYFIENIRASPCLTFDQFAWIYEMDKENKQRENVHVECEQDVWGYIVCFGTIITSVASIGHVNSFGLIYYEFISDTGSTAKSLTTAHGVFGIMLAIGGFILKLISKWYTLRVGGYLGAILLSTGSLLTIFISNTNQLPLTFGVLQGIGFGIMVPVCYSAINHYFVKRRTAIMSICKATQGIIFMWYPLLIEGIMSSYGFRGTLLILTGLSLHVFPGMATMKTRDFGRNENMKEQTREHTELLEDVRYRTEFIEVKEVKSNTEKLWFHVMDFLNIKVWKDLVYCNICIGQSFVNFSDLTFFMLQPMLLFQYGYDATNVALCISIGAGSDVTGRCALAVLSYFKPLNTRLLFYLATLFTFFFRIVLLQVRQFIWIALVTGTLGLLRAFLHVASPLVIANHVSHEEFPGAYASFMLATGIVQVVCAPLVGLIKDTHEDFIPAFYVLTMCCVPCLIFWPVEYILKK